ncbi:MAG: flagellar biosynthetic protein FliR [Alphaproteobacteria bacterium]
MLAEVLTENIFVFLTVFARIGAAMMLMPPFGDTFILRRTRLSLALAVSLVIMPVAAPALPALPPGPIALTLILAGEIAVGLFIGGLARVVFSGLHTASLLVAYNTGLATASLFAPGQDEHGVMVSRFFTMTALVLLFATDLHQALLLALAESYEVLPLAGLPPVGDFAEQALDFISGAFVVAVQVAAPLLIAGLLLWVGFGLLARLMPTMQVFFVALPLQIAFGFWVLMIALPGMMLWYFDYFEESIGRLLVAG